MVQSRVVYRGIDHIQHQEMGRCFHYDVPVKGNICYMLTQGGAYNEVDVDMGNVGDTRTYDPESTCNRGRPARNIDVPHDHDDHPYFHLYPYS